MSGKLGLPPKTVDRCRSLAREVAAGVREETDRFTTVATERAVARLLGVDGVDSEDVPVPNRLVDSVRAAGRLDRGVAVWLGSAVAEGEPDAPAAAARL